MTLATDSRRAQWGNGAKQAILSRKYVLIRISIGLLIAGAGVLLITR